MSVPVVRVPFPASKGPVGDVSVPAWSVESEPVDEYSNASASLSPDGVLVLRPPAGLSHPSESLFVNRIVPFRKTVTTTIRGSDGDPSRVYMKHSLPGEPYYNRVSCTASVVADPITGDAVSISVSFSRESVEAISSSYGMHDPRDAGYYDLHWLDSVDAVAIDRATRQYAEIGGMFSRAGSEMVYQFIVGYAWHGTVGVAPPGSVYVAERNVTTGELVTIVYFVLASSSTEGSVREPVSYDVMTVADSLDAEYRLVTSGSVARSINELRDMTLAVVSLARDALSKKANAPSSSSFNGLSSVDARMFGHHHKVYTAETFLDTYVDGDGKNSRASVVFGITGNHMYASLSELFVGPAEVREVLYPGVDYIKPKYDPATGEVVNRPLVGKPTYVMERVPVADCYYVRGPGFDLFNGLNPGSPYDNPNGPVLYYCCSDYAYDGEKPVQYRSYQDGDPVVTGTGDVSRLSGLESIVESSVVGGAYSVSPEDLSAAKTEQIVTGYDNNGLRYLSEVRATETVVEPDKSWTAALMAYNARLVLGEIPGVGVVGDVFIPSASYAEELRKVILAYTGLTVQRRIGYSVEGHVLTEDELATLGDLSPRPYDEWPDWIRKYMTPPSARIEKIYDITESGKVPVSGFPPSLYLTREIDCNTVYPGVKCSRFTEWYRGYSRFHAYAVDDSEMKVDITASRTELLHVNTLNQNRTNVDFSFIVDFDDSEGCVKIGTMGPNGYPLYSRHHKIFKADLDVRADWDGHTPFYVVIPSAPNFPLTPRWLTVRLSTQRSEVIETDGRMKIVKFTEGGTTVLTEEVQVNG